MTVEPSRQLIWFGRALRIRGSKNGKAHSFVELELLAFTPQNRR
jgi:hypothetical protein